MMVYKNNFISTATTGSATSQGALSSTSICLSLSSFISISTPVFVYAWASILSSAFLRLMNSLENRNTVHSVCVRKCVVRFGVVTLRCFLRMRRYVNDCRNSCICWRATLTQGLVLASVLIIRRVHIVAKSAY
jgi:hypothetical protein